MLPTVSGMAETDGETAKGEEEDEEIVGGSKETWNASIPGCKAFASSLKSFIGPVSDESTSLTITLGVISKRGATEVGG